MNDRLAGFERLRVVSITASRWIGAARDIALPNQCALCGNLSQDLLCGGCDQQYWNEARFRCPVCALPSDSKAEPETLGKPCSACRIQPSSFDATFTAGDYRAPLDTLALELKFHARSATGQKFARLLKATSDSAYSPAPDVIAPVPLAPSRLRTRGYNQAWSIARPLAKLLNIRADPMLLERTRDTAPQSKLDLDSRRLNVGDAFRVRQDVRGRHVAVVDDVMTSGATLDALARTLKAAGAARVTNFVALRTPQD